MSPSLRMPLHLLAPLALLLSPSAAFTAERATSGRILQDGANETTSVPTSSPTVASDGTPWPTAEGLEPWGGCVDPRDRDAKVVRGRETAVCLTLGPAGKWNRVVEGAGEDGGPGGVDYMRYSFLPAADEYSVYRVPDSFQNLIVEERKTYLLPNDNPAISVHAASGASGALSFLRHWYEKDANNTARGKIFPHLTAIIDVKRGDVAGITWDDACVFCHSGRCLENTYDFNGLTGKERNLKEQTKGCYLTYEECVKIHRDGGNECDLTLFVVWTGDDANGNVMSSSNSRFSAFQPQQIQDRWGQRIGDSIKSVSDTGQSIKDSITDGIDDLNPFADDEEDGEGSN